MRNRGCGYGSQRAIEIGAERMGSASKADSAGSNPDHSPASRKLAHLDGSTPASARAARRFVGECLDEARVRAPWWQLLTGELAANVIEHANTDFDVVVTIDESTLRVEFHDGAAATHAFRNLVNQPPISVPVTSPSGRGWLLIGATAARSGLNDLANGGKAVWFEIALDPS